MKANISLVVCIIAIINSVLISSCATYQNNKDLEKEKQKIWEELKK